MKPPNRQRDVFRASDKKPRIKGVQVWDLGHDCVLEPADLPGVVVPQLLVQPVRVSLLSLDLGDDVKDVGVGAAGAGAPVSVGLALRLAAAVV